ncbi:alpha/beta hydrolase [Actinomadura parmotrematis]|uniref:Acyl-CoA:diacylglycerol acyltransferase n=1 Tax=Actinomadura parmotrematis TaxID=2864039 RepID=A0ABS7FRL4_9ACTN|nr:alpha/beta hydrolase family protein [Actinomadura parmotrematis]MBW8482951.1 esterase family protein [Actinomadura parmotrematis]
MSGTPRGRRGLRAALAALTTAAAAVALAAPAAPADAAGTVKADTGARIVARKQLDAHTFDITVKTPSLAKTAPVRVITPKGWSATSARRWPVLYTFHGGVDHYESWTRSTDIEQLAAKWNVLVVMPEADVDGSYTDWYNYGKGGTPKWETFHTTDVVQLMERNFRASTVRAAMGISSGGEGAFTYAARHKGMFRYAASFSGILHLTKPGIPAILMAEGVYGMGDGGNDPFRIWGPITGDMANWKAHDPYLLANNLRGTGLYISSGLTGNPGALDPKVTGYDFLKARVLGGVSEQVAGSASQSMAARLKQLGIPATTHFYQDGWHQWAYWQIEMHTAWPLIMKSIGATRAA